MHGVGGILGTLLTGIFASNALIGNRVNAEEEQQGLDIVSHNERGYDL